jgi:hypothetical protein
MNAGLVILPARPGISDHPQPGLGGSPAVPEPAQPHTPAEVAVYNFMQGKLLFAAGDDLPQPEAPWLADDRTIYIRAERLAATFSRSASRAGVPFLRAAGMLARFPEEWQAWVAVWEA